jgi:hypothetical protein
MPSGTGKTVSLLSLIVSYQQVPSSSYFTREYLPADLLVFPFTSETNLLFAYSSGDRESTYGTEKINGIPNIICRNRGTESYRTGFLGLRADKSEKSMHQSRGSIIHAVGYQQIDLLNLKGCQREEGQSCRCTMSGLNQLGRL